MMHLWTYGSVQERRKQRDGGEALVSIFENMGDDEPHNEVMGKEKTEGRSERRCLL